MAEKITRTLIDDIDGSDATHSRTFTVDGKTYRLDLSDKNNERFNKALGPFLPHATRVRPNTSSTTTNTTKPRATTRGANTTERGYDLTELRAWAKRKRIKIPARGRIPAATVQRYLDDPNR